MLNERWTSLQFQRSASIIQPSDGLAMLGSAKRITITKDDTTIVEGRGENAAIQGRIAQIRRQIEDTDSDYDREKPV